MKDKLVSICTVITCVCLAGCGTKVSSENLTAGMNYIEELNYQQALDAFETGFENDEDKELLLRGQGIAYMGLSQYEDAKNAFLESIQNAGQNVTSLEIDTNFYLAAAEYKLGEYEEAKNIYTAIINYKGKNLDAYYLRGCCELKTGEYENAMADFSLAFSMDPKNMDLIISAYEELACAGYSQEAVALLQDKMDNNTTSLTESQKGTLYFYLGDYESARIFLDQAVSHGDMSMSLLLGRTYEKLGDMNYACVVYQAYIDADNENAEIYNNLGICLMAQGKYGEALDSFQKGINLGNSNVIQNLYFNRIVAYEKLARFDLAKDLMTEYLSYYPDDSKALREYEFLKTR